MRKWTSVLAAVSVAVAPLAVASPATARSIGVADETGDTLDAGLDITYVSFRNRDRVIQASLNFHRDRRGTVIVFAEARNGPGVRIVIQHPSKGADETFVINARGKEVSCRGGADGPGVSSVWDRQTSTVTLRMPSRCMAGGNYGAVRFSALIEGFRSQSSDVDYAPEKPNGDLAFTDFISRG